MDNSVLVTIVVQSIAFAIGLFKIYSDVQVRMKELEIRLQSVEKQDDKIYEKLETIQDTMNDIKLQLKDKQNR